MSDEPEFSIELGPIPKIALGALNLTISGALSIRLDELQPPAGSTTLFVIFAIAGMLVGVAAGFKSAPKQPLVLAIPVVAGLIASLWYSSIVAGAGLTQTQLYLAAALYVGDATILGYVLTSVERVLMVRQVIPIKKKSVAKPNTQQSSASKKR